MIDREIIMFDLAHLREGLRRGHNRAERRLFCRLSVRRSLAICTADEIKAPDRAACVLAGPCAAMGGQPGGVMSCCRFARDGWRERRGAGRGSPGCRGISA